MLKLDAAIIDREKLTPLGSPHMKSELEIRMGRLISGEIARGGMSQAEVTRAHNLARPVNDRTHAPATKNL